MKRSPISCLVLAAAVAAAGCYGPFRLTKKLHAWNDDVGEKWVKEGVFLGMVIIPVYGFAVLGDAIIFNSMEFWTGDNPIASRRIRTIQDGDKQVVMSYRPEDRSLKLVSMEGGRHVSTVILEPDGKGRMVARSGDGELLMLAKSQGDEVVIRSPSGKEVARYTGRDLERLLSK